MITSVSVSDAQKAAYLLLLAQHALSWWLLFSLFLVLVLDCVTADLGFMVFCLLATGYLPSRLLRGRRRLHRLWPREIPLRPGRLLSG